MFLMSRAYIYLICLFLGISIFGSGCASFGTEAHLKSPTAEGPVSETIKKNKSKLEGCISQSISLNGGEGMRMVVNFIIDADGRVSKAEVEKISAPDPDFAECVIHKLRRMEFPRPKDKMDHKIRYPLIFEQAAS